MEVFAVFREGVYRHQCGGVFSSREAAICVADKLAANDVDDWHTYDVVPYTIDSASPVGDSSFRSSPQIIESKAIHSSRKS